MIVRTKPDTIVPHNESSGVFNRCLLEPWNGRLPAWLLSFGACLLLDVVVRRGGRSGPWQNQGGDGRSNVQVADLPAEYRPVSRGRTEPSRLRTALQTNDLAVSGRRSAVRRRADTRGRRIG